jgi:predicted AlkP superfamily phosphohydrolase/phosphomutase
VVRSGQRIESGPGTAVDWSETSAFFGTLSGQCIYVNLEDRFADGVVPREEYDRVVEAVREAVLDIRDPETDEPLIRNVYRRDEVFEGWAVVDGPPLVESASAYTLTSGRSESLVEPATQHGRDRSGDHRRAGIFVAAGPSFGAGSVEDASVLDVAPTLLTLHGCPIPDVVDGSVLETVFEDPAAASERRYTAEHGRVNREAREWTQSERAEIEEHLDNLGYMD